MPLLAEMPVIIFSEADAARIKERSDAIAGRKASEGHHKVDYAMREERFNTGVIGEIALEQYLDIKFADLEVGPSTKFHVPDMKGFGLNIGVKTSCLFKNNTAMIPRAGKDHNLEPQIIMVRLGSRTAVVAGYATTEVLRTYRDDFYLKDDRAKDRKTGFYGYEHLIPFKNLEELKRIHNDNT